MYEARIELPRKRLSTLFTGSDPDSCQFISYRYALVPSKGSSEVLEASEDGKSSSQLWRSFIVRRRDVQNQPTLDYQVYDGVSVPEQPKRKLSDLMGEPDVLEELEYAFERCLPRLIDQVSSHSTLTSLNFSFEFVSVVQKFIYLFEKTSSPDRYMRVIGSYFEKHLGYLDKLPNDQPKLNIGFMVLITSEEMKNLVPLLSLYEELHRRKLLLSFCSLLLTFSRKTQNTTEDYTKSLVESITSRLEDRSLQPGNGILRARDLVYSAIRVLLQLPADGKVCSMLLLPLYHVLQENFVAFQAPSIDFDKPNRSTSLNDEWWGTSPMTSKVDEVRAAFANIDMNFLRGMYDRLAVSALQVDPATSRAFVNFMSLEQLVEFSGSRYDAISIEAIVAVLTHHFTVRNGDKNYNLNTLHQAIEKACRRLHDPDSNKSTLQIALDKLNDVKDSSFSVWLKTIESAMLFGRELFEVTFHYDFI